MAISENEEERKDQLTCQALKLFIEKTHRENAETRSWIKQPNNFISAVALILSLIGIGYQFLKDRSDGIDNNLAAVSKIASDLTQMDSQITTSTTLSQDEQIAINNRRVVLLAEADRLIKDLGDRVPTSQLAVLAPEYADINDINTSLKYLLLLTSPSSSPTERLDAWRSIAVLESYQGPDAVKDARNAFKQAALVFPDPKDIGSISLELTVREQWAAFEYQSQNYMAASQQYVEARSLASRFPCTPARMPIVARIEAEGQAALESLRTGNSANASQALVAWSQVIDADKCPKIVPPTSPKVAVSPSSSGITTICQFTSGPRKGTTFDFQKLGIQGIPVGSPCTDGLSSYGIAIGPSGQPGQRSPGSNNL